VEVAVTLADSLEVEAEILAVAVAAQISNLAR
jgi:hypothetical protein